MSIGSLITRVKQNCETNVRAQFYRLSHAAKNRAAAKMPLLPRQHCLCLCLIIRSQFSAMLLV